MAGQKIYAYLRVSTVEQNTEKNKADILSYANNNGFLGKVEFIEEKVTSRKSWKNRKLYDLVQSMKDDDILIVPELSRLGRSLVEVLEVLEILSTKGAKVYSAKENFQLNSDDMASKVMRTMFALFAEIERDLISERTKEGLAAAKASGKKLGRPKGVGKSRLDKYEEEIIALLKSGSTKKFVAERCGVTPAALYNWLKKHNLNDIQPKP